MDPLLKNFDEFVDDLLSSENNLLKAEMDLLIMQHIFESIDLDSLKDIEHFDNDCLAA